MLTSMPSRTPVQGDNIMLKTILIPTAMAFVLTAACDQIRTPGNVAAQNDAEVTEPAATPAPEAPCCCRGRRTRHCDTEARRN